MKRPKKFVFALFFIAMIFVVSAVVQWLWNFTLPNITTAKPISYWQAMALLALSKILFSSFRGRGHGKGPWAKNWKNMSSEDRQKMRDYWKERHKSKETNEPEENN